MPPSMNIYLQL